jgi:hypothetical protein
VKQFDYEGLESINTGDSVVEQRVSFHKLFFLLTFDTFIDFDILEDV